MHTAKCTITSDGANGRTTVAKGVSTNKRLLDDATVNCISENNSPRDDTLDVVPITFADSILLARYDDRQGTVALSSMDAIRQWPHLSSGPASCCRTAVTASEAA